MHDMERDPMYEYKGYLYWEEDEYDDDVIKTYHVVRKPDGGLTHVDWSPYSSMTLEDFKLWIDLDRPGRVQTKHGSHNLDTRDLLRIRDELAIEAMDRMICD